ncbi:hypothetical protein YH62_10495 [Rhizobium sp. LC145]|nr:hypothetical protein YH62_10495 [Rhizobium sp. LC145]
MLGLHLKMQYNQIVMPYANFCTIDIEFHAGEEFGRIQNEHLADMHLGRATAPTCPLRTSLALTIDRRE